MTLNHEPLSFFLYGRHTFLKSLVPLDAPDSFSAMFQLLPVAGDEDLNFEGDVLAFRLSGEAIRTRSRMTGPLLIWVSTYFTKDGLFDLFCLSLPILTI